jgi:hypothetical protein
LPEKQQRRVRHWFPARTIRKKPFIARHRKAYLNFELKDHDRRRRRAFGASLASKFR